MFEKCTACQGAGFTIDKSKLSWQEIECKVCQGKGTIRKEERKQGEIAYGFGNYGPIHCSGACLDTPLMIDFDQSKLPRLTG